MRTLVITLLLITSATAQQQQMTPSQMTVALVSAITQIGQQLEQLQKENAALRAELDKLKPAEPPK